MLYLEQNIPAYQTSVVFSKRRMWLFAWTTLAAAFALTIMLTVAATHHHVTTAEESECVVCDVIHHDVTDIPSLNFPSLALVYSLHVLNSYGAHIVEYQSPFLQPPSCGPPLR